MLKGSLRVWPILQWFVFLLNIPTGPLHASADRQPISLPGSLLYDGLTSFAREVLPPHLELKPALSTALPTATMLALHSGCFLCARAALQNSQSAGLET